MELGARSAGAARPSSDGRLVRPAPPTGYGSALPLGREMRADCSHDRPGRCRAERRDWRAAAARRWAAWLRFVLGVYAVVVVGGGWLLGRTAVPGARLPVLATAVVALAFDPVHDRLRSLAARRAAHGRSSRRSRCSASSPAPSPGSTPPRSCRRGWRGCSPRAPARRGHGCGCVGGDRLVLAAELAAAGASRTGDRSAARVTSDRPAAGGWTSGTAETVLGVLVVQERPHVPPHRRSRSGCSPGSPPRPGSCSAPSRLRSELEGRADELAARAEELRRSRQRLVDAQDDERRRLERDIHDGAQQHLVALAVNLRLAQTLAERTRTARSRS